MRAFDLVLPSLPERRCRVRVGRGLLARVEEEWIAAPPGRPLVILSDSNVERLHAGALTERLVRHGLPAVLVTFPAGERNKTRRTKTIIEDRLLAAGAGRECAVVSVGGGVVGDLAGFVASTWYRGVPVVQVPTTLLAMADSALGGKTAVNLPGGKNLVGAFHHPRAVHADLDLLTTLDDRTFRNGFAEMVKSAAVADAGLFRWLEEHAVRLVSRDPEALEHAVFACLRIKAAVVREDERDHGRRAALNFGHTVAHAVEAVTGFRVPHGEAVAVGMVAEARVAERLAGFPADGTGRIRRLLGELGIPPRWPRGCPPADVVKATRADKKGRADEIRCSLLRSLGAPVEGASPAVEVDERLLLQALDAEASEGPGTPD